MTIKKSDQNRICSFEMWCWRRMLGVSWRQHRTDASILEQLGIKSELMTKVVRVKLAYFGHVARGSVGDMALMVMEGSVEGKRHHGAPRKCWLDNIREWSGRTYSTCKALVQNRKKWRGLSWEWARSVIQPLSRVTL